MEDRLDQTTNRVTILGIVSRTPEIKTMQNGSKICGFSVLSGNTYPDRQTGEIRTIKVFNKVSIMVPTFVDTIEKENIGEGDLVYIEGRLETKNYNDNFYTEITIRPYHGTFTLISRASQGEVPNTGESEQSNEDSIPF